MTNTTRPMLFLCWSGARSKQIAEAFKQYFERILETSETEAGPRVAMSETLIAKGAPWSAQLLTDLGEAGAGIVCVTPENRGSTWLHFEGGAIIASHKLKQEGAGKAPAAQNRLFGFLFTLDDAQIEGPLSLFQSTIYRRDYDRDRAELARLTAAVRARFHEGRPLPPESNGDREHHLDVLLGRLRELQYLGFRDLVPGLEGHARQVIQAGAQLTPLPNRVYALSALVSLQNVLEARAREAEVVCAPSQRMFFERLLDVLSAARRVLERNLVEGSDVAAPLEELVRRLARLLEAAVEPVMPVLDDSWRFALYAIQASRHEAYRKQKLLLIHPLESALQRAELDDPVHTAGRTRWEVPPGHLLSHNERLRALRSFWAYDRVAAYIHYCEEVSQLDHELEKTLFELTRAVLKEIALIEASPTAPGGELEADDLPLRFALRALILKIKIATGHGSFAPGAHAPQMDPSQVRTLIESRVHGETGLSFDSAEQLLSCLRMVADKIGARSPIDLEPPLARLCDDFERLIGSGAPGPALAPHVELV